jgi:1-acyl-sn-glycerol-3-phosphate acyltransferase
MIRKRHITSSDDPKWAPAFYEACTRLTWLVLTLLADWRIQGIENVPRSGALIVAANHLNIADPPLLAAALPRRIRFMAKQELFANSLLDVCFRAFGAFPVKRFEVDRKALRTARSLLRSNQAVGMFPEGHRSRQKGLLAAHPGTAFLALRTGAPVLPVAITGTERINSPRIIVRRPRITVSIGHAVTFDKTERAASDSVHEASDRIMAAIAELLPASYRGVYTRSQVG